MRLLCEGHHQKMQNYLREQPGSGYDIDMLTEVVKFSLAVAEELDHDNAIELNGCVQLLCECVQGETSGKNPRLLLETKLFIMAGRMLTMSPYSEADGPLPAVVLARLRNDILMLLHSVLEGNEEASKAQLRSLLNLNTLAEMAMSWRDTTMRAQEELIQIGARSKADIDGEGSAGANTAALVQSNVELAYMLLVLVLNLIYSPHIYVVYASRCVCEYGARPKPAPSVRLYRPSHSNHIVIT